MHVISDTEVRVFTDPSGDTLSLLTAVRQRDLEKCEDLQRKEALESIRELNIDIEEVMNKVMTEEERKAAEERTKAAGHSASIRRFRLQAVARAMVIGGKEISHSAILGAYDDMDPESARWVDEQVETVWAGVPGEAQREGEAAVPADAL